MACYRVLILGDLPIHRTGKGFHGDRVFQNFVKELISFFHASSFIETGTYYGDSTLFVANATKNIIIYSCDVNETFIKIAKYRLKNYSNVNIFKLSSEKFIKLLLSEYEIGVLPIFFLDAHWYEYWPLKDELSEIFNSNIPAIIIIDDVKVPGKQEFGYDVHNRHLDIRIILKQLFSKRNVYNVLYPTYTKEKAFFKEDYTNFKGYLTIFQNLKKPFENLKDINFIKSNYMEYNIEFEEHIN